MSKRSRRGRSGLVVGSAAVLACALAGPAAAQTVPAAAGGTMSSPTSPPTTGPGTSPPTTGPATSTTTEPTTTASNGATPGSNGSTAGSLSSSFFAGGNPTLTQPDDITTLDGRIYVGWQNGVGPDGTPSKSGAKASTVVEYAPTGRRLQSWSLTGHADGLTADAVHHDLIVTVNEDGNSSLSTIDPGGKPQSQVHHYGFSPNPLPHGGGTDAVSVYHGQIFVSASAPTSASGPALYRVQLEGDTAQVQPVFFDNSQATVANTATSTSGQAVTLALTDPDSNIVVPAGSSRFAGSLMLDSQGDQQQVYVTGADTLLPQLSVLNLSQAVDDTAFATSTRGTLYVTDGADDEVVAVTGTFAPGTAFVAVTPGSANTPAPGNNYLGRLDLGTGTIQPVATNVQAKGLLFVGQ